MDFLQVSNGKIVDARGKPVWLRGTCVGGWMNMEHFLNGYPGAEYTLRMAMAEVLSPSKAEFFFDRLLDYMLAEEDIRFMRSIGATVVRLPLNYHHFESDLSPFEYLDKGFQRLDQALDWCSKNSLYAILDLHSVQGWQNTDWHCDNDTRHTLFWRERQYQDRFVALWEEFARRYRDRPEVAGYNVMNEPVTGAPLGRFYPDQNYRSNWPVINSVYRRVVEAIRAIDTRHLIFLEGDLFSQRFNGLDEPFAQNLVYSSHNYIPPCFGTGSNSERTGANEWNRSQIFHHIERHEGVKFAQKHNVPLWSGEFGAGYSPDPVVENEHVRALDDEIDAFEAHGVHWTTWSYKDIGAMSWLVLRKDSPYLQAIKPVLEAKRQLHTDFFDLEPLTPAVEAVRSLARIVEKTLADPEIDPRANEMYLAQSVLNGYVATQVQQVYARCFKDMSESQIDDVLKSFALVNCSKRDGYIDIMKKHFMKEVPDER